MLGKNLYLLVGIAARCVNVYGVIALLRGGEHELLFVADLARKQFKRHRQGSHHLMLIHNQLLHFNLLFRYCGGFG